MKESRSPSGSRLRPPPSWIGAMLRCSRFALAYHRCRAGSFRIALLGFATWLRDEFHRFASMGSGNHAKLLSLEAACAEAGLSFAVAGASTVPWRLPSTFIDLPLEELPQHPLVDATALKSLVRSRLGDHPRAIDALTLLLADDLQSDRWDALDATRKRGAKKARVAVCLHFFHPDVWPALRPALEAIPEPWDLIITTPRFACTRAFDLIRSAFPTATVVPCPNRGRDIYPFLHVLSKGLLDDYDAVCKVHTKRSPHMSRGAQWRDAMVACLLGAPLPLDRTLQRFRVERDLGLIGPGFTLVDADQSLTNRQNHELVAWLADRIGISPTRLERPFFAGTMFWVRPSALVRLRDSNLAESDFPVEMGQTDGTLAHAMERMFWSIVEDAGFRVDAITNGIADQGPQIERPFDRSLPTA